MSVVKKFGAVNGIMSIKTHLNGAFGFSVFLDLDFLFMGKIWHGVKKRSGYILSYISSQTLAVSPANNYLVHMWPNLWWNNSKAVFFLDGNFFVFDISFISPKNVCFLCALFGNVTAFSLFIHSTPCKTFCGVNKCIPDSLT